MRKTKPVANVLQTSKAIALIFILGVFLVACGQDQGETGDSDVSGEAADVAQESEELAEAVGEEIEEEVTDVATAVAEAGEEASTAAAETGEEVGTAAAETGEEIQEESGGVLPQEITDADGVTISELDDDVEAYAGQNVAVRGDIVETIGTHAFVISDPSALGGDEILVVGSNIDTSTVDVGNTVEVAGTAEGFDLIAVENQTGLDLQDDLFADFREEDVVLFANQVVNIAETGGDSNGGY
jgi:UDP-N-acetylmuramyl pentapeptide synthase